MGVMQEPVEDGVRDGGVADPSMPLFDRQLRGDYGGVPLSTVVHDFQKIFSAVEQCALIESLNANLHRVLKWRFGPKSEHIEVDQLGLFVDGSVVVEVPAPPAGDSGRSAWW